MCLLCERFRQLQCTRDIWLTDSTRPLLRLVICGKSLLSTFDLSYPFY